MLHRLAGRPARLACLAALAAACGNERTAPVLPVVSAASPQLFCTRQLTTRLDVAGSNFQVPTAAGGTDPELWLERTALLDGTAVTKSSVQVPPASLTWTGTGAVSFPAAPGLSLTGGVYALWVQNPDGAWGSLSPALAAAPPPEITQVSVLAECASVQPLVILTVSGTGFLRTAGSAPLLAITDEQSTSLALSPTYLEGCTPAAPGLLTGVDVCTALVLELAPGTLEAGSWSIRVTNPAPAACATAIFDGDATAASCP